MGSVTYKEVVDNKPWRVTFYGFIVHEIYIYSWLRSADEHL